MSLKGVSAFPGKKYAFLKRGKIPKMKMKDCHLLPSRTILTRPTQRSCAIPSSIIRFSVEGHRGTLLKSTMRMFPAKLRDPESPWQEVRLNIHFYTCLLPPGMPDPQKMNMNFSCLKESPLTFCNSHIHLRPLLRPSFPIYSEVVGLAFV
ncbi:germinal center-associated signaling and motility protein isoform X9 [Piliocolobus tephrosceles]|uniref:germinal center-associated signaling and motility protein isoform X9 n=1 Tax=Piliocolobus tephrosceles TaxID=591936 RepID=UPI000C295DA9|nr:germinal center-associated signaling and motility protein isoform X9 [Piliocolobus tephrosceles]